MLAAVLCNVPAFLGGVGGYKFTRFTDREWETVRARLKRLLSQATRKKRPSAHIERKLEEIAEIIPSPSLLAGEFQIRATEGQRLIAEILRAIETRKAEMAEMEDEEVILWLM